MSHDTEPAPPSDAAEAAVARLDSKLDRVLGLLGTLVDNGTNQHHVISTLKVRCPVLQGNGHDCEEGGLLGR